MNLSQLPKWQKENPASEVLDTKEINDYIKYSMNALGGKSIEECYYAFFHRKKIETFLILIFYKH